MYKLIYQVLTWWERVKKMALHDTDKNSDSRANPSLNADDGVNNRMAHETNSTTYRTAGLAEIPSLAFQQGAIRGKDNAGQTNVFFGYDPALNATRSVLRVAKDGFDATTATDAQLIFNSEQNVFKIIATGTATIPLIAAQTPGNFANNLTVISTGISAGTSVFSAMCFITSTEISGATPYTPLPFTGTQLGYVPAAGPSSGGVAYTIKPYTRITAGILELVINVLTYDNSSSNGPWTLRYYILQETAN